MSGYKNSYILKKILLYLLLVLFAQSAEAQNLKKLIADGKSALENQEYFLAENYFKKAIDIDSVTTELQYFYAQACRLDLNYGVAERWYQKVYKKDNGKQYPDALFYLALCKKSNGHYKDAGKMFDKYAKRQVKKNPSMASKAQQESKNCAYALMLIKNPLPIKITHLDTNVNTKGGEYAPFEIDSNLFFTGVFTDGHQLSTRILKSKIKGKKYTHYEVLDSIVNKRDWSVSNVVFNNEATNMYCTMCEGSSSDKSRCAIYVFNVRNQIFDSGTKLPPEINYENALNTQPHISKINGQEVLFFSSNRTGGFGGMDIWYSIKDKNGAWQKAINAGTHVNSVEDEISPFFCAQCGVLFFSTSFLKGMGGFDIFKSAFQDNTFKEPENMGYPINSPMNDIYFKYNHTRSKAYLVSNRSGSYFEKHQTCCNDIYYFNITDSLESPLTQTKVHDTLYLAKARLQTLVPLSLYFNNDEPDSKTTNTTTTKSYTETLNAYLALKGSYLKAYAKGLDDERKEIALNEMNDFFEDSVRASYQELEHFSSLLLFVLNKGENVNLTIKGYCSPLASTTYNINLAKRRISCLINYFKAYQNGVLLPYLQNEDRIKIIIEEIGELEASPLVSDNPNDATNAVYSRAAALERKIQIIAVSTKKE